MHINTWLNWSNGIITEQIISSLHTKCILFPHSPHAENFKLNCHKDENNHFAHTLWGLNGNKHASFVMWHYLLEADCDTLKGNDFKLTFNCVFLCHSLSCLSTSEGIQRLQISVFHWEEFFSRKPSRSDTRTGLLWQSRTQRGPIGFNG